MSNLRDYMPEKTPLNNVYYWFKIDNSIKLLEFKGMGDRSKGIQYRNFKNNETIFFNDKEMWTKCSHCIYDKLKPENISENIIKMVEEYIFGNDD